jgi:polyhydroxyalkanoate synthesis regulator phasin
MKAKTMKKQARRAGTTVRKTAHRQGRRVGAAADAAAGSAGAVLRDTWHSTLVALTTAEQEVAKQVRLLLKRNRIQSRDAAGVLRELGSRAEVERRKAMKDLEARLATLQSRMQKERKVVGEAVGDAVTGALARLNIPSRREVKELTRKVDQLGAKIDDFRKRSARRAKG